MNSLYKQTKQNNKADIIHCWNNQLFPTIKKTIYNTRVIPTAKAKGAFKV